MASAADAGARTGRRVTALILGLAVRIRMSERVLVASTGGTIASTAGEAGAAPTKTGEDLVGSVPELEGRIRVANVAQRPSVDVDFEVLDRLRKRVTSHDAGVVVTHGTDTMAESAYYLDLLADVEGPVVFTGAQRRPDQPGADGPANLLAAVGAAEEPAVEAAGGVYVCLNDELHAARDVVKAHTWRLDAFESPGRGPVGALAPGGFERHRELGSRSASLRVEGAPAGDVPVLTTGIGVGREGIDRALDAGCEGLVLQATGLGNAPESVADAVAEAVETGVPVVVTSRCHAGGVAAVYGGGGGHTLEGHGAVLAGDLPAPKARIKLLLALASETDIDEAFDG
jgi:L-asparaginase